MALLKEVGAAQLHNESTMEQKERKNSVLVSESETKHKHKQRPHKLTEQELLVLGDDAQR